MRFLKDLKNKVFGTFTRMALNVATTEPSEVLTKKASGSAIIETLMIIIVCVAICAVFRNELTGLLDGVWATLRAAVMGLFGTT